MKECFNVLDLPPFSYKMSADRTAGEDELKWSGPRRLPNIGDTVDVKINAIGLAVVEGYFMEYGWLGLLVKPANPPEWFVKQNGRGARAHVFGAELK